MKADTSKTMQEILAAAEIPDRDSLLVARQVTHGSFADNAYVSQTMKKLFRSLPGWDGLTDIERESLDMIALKFSRILSGRSRERQHWEDVVGYGNLALEDCP